MANPQSYRPATGEIPAQPGVYRFHDEQGRILYVGKAKSLRSRLTSYFADPASLHPRTAQMVTTASGVMWTVVNTEVEALQLEWTWIKEFNPRFNVMYRDDKSYPWLAVTMNEEFPRVLVTRENRRKGVRYFGPYVQAWAIRETIDTLLPVFPMRSCSPGVFAAAKRSGRPCLLGHIGKCAAPCVGTVSPAEHRAIAEDLCSFVQGHTAGFLREIERRMKEASEAEHYEQAARLRDQLGSLRVVLEKQAVVLGSDADADVIALAADPLEVAVETFYVRGGRIRGQRGWVADRVDDADEAGLVEDLLLQMYADVDAEAIPREVLVPMLPPDAASVEQLLAERRGAAVSLRVPQRGEKRVLMQTVAKNAAEVLARHKTRRASDLTTRNRALAELTEALDLPEVPLRIEGYDVSHLQGTDVVASMVVFEDGLARKSEYRRYLIKGFSGQNDVAAIREVLTRRLKRLADDESLGGEGLVDPATGVPVRFAYRPQLIVVDGGEPQVAAAAAAMEELGVTGVALVGLAKRLEEVWVPGEEDPVILPRSSEGLYLLQRLRDEAHRFAITHQRGKRTASMIRSVLDEVPGLGEARRRALLKHFGSVRKLREATEEDLAAVPGIGDRLARAILDRVREDGPRDR